MDHPIYYTAPNPDVLIARFKPSSCSKGRPSFLRVYSGSISTEQMTIHSNINSDGVSGSTDRSSTANEEIQLPEDLADLAKEEDRVIASNRAWPLPFTITKAGTDHAYTQEYVVKTGFVFTYHVPRTGRGPSLGGHHSSGFETR
jgi:hypothetical protein